MLCEGGWLVVYQTNLCFFGKPKRASGRVYLAIGEKQYRSGLFMRVEYVEQSNYC